MFHLNRLNRNMLIGFGIVLIGLVACLIEINLLYDGSRTSTAYSISIPEQPTESLHYRVWTPVGTVPQNDHVVFLIHGYCASQEMMLPLMRELTERGYHVITLDLRGHGRSGGVYENEPDNFLTDFDAIYGDFFSHSEYQWLNATHITIVGHSMGGLAAAIIGSHYSHVFTTIGIAPAAFGNFVNQTHPSNFAVIIGNRDQFFTTEFEMSNFRNASPSAEFGILTGSASNRDARKISIIAGATHEGEMTHDGCLSEAVAFIEYSYGNLSFTEWESITTNQEFRMLWIYFAFGLGIVSILLLGLFGIGLISTHSEQTKQTENNERSNQYSFQLNLYLNSNPAQPHKTFFKRWFSWIALGLIFAAISYQISLWITPAGFGNMIIFLIALPGWTSLFVLSSYVKSSENGKSDHCGRFGDLGYFRKVIQQLLQKTWQNATELIVGLILASFTLLIFNITYGINYILLFPLNLRALYVILWIPFAFFMYMMQSWLFQGVYQSQNLDQKGGFWKTWISIFIAKFSFYFIGGIIDYIFGGSYITFIILLTLLDIIVSFGSTLFYQTYRNVRVGIIWASLIIPLGYLGYGVFMGPF